MSTGAAAEFAEENPLEQKTKKPHPPRYTETGLGAYHPLVSFSYFACVIAFSLLFAHPVYAYISLFCAIGHGCQLGGRRAVLASVALGLPMWLCFAAGNPLFNHHGSTYLFYFQYNPITLEATVYGLVAAGMMFASTMWFFCYNEVVTSDKFLYIFGKLAPTVALIASMTLRLIPRLIAQIKHIAESQRTVGLSVAVGPPLKRVKSGMRILSILLTWALEDAVVTADSMRARGYGYRRRTNFSIFRFCRRDRALLGLIAALTGAGVLAYLLRIGWMLYYPVLAQLRLDAAALLFYAAFLALGLLPSIITAKENARWKFLK